MRSLPYLQWKLLAWIGHELLHLIRKTTKGQISPNLEITDADLSPKLAGCFGWCRAGVVNDLLVREMRRLLTTKCADTESLKDAYPSHRSINWSCVPVCTHFCTVHCSFALPRANSAWQRGPVLSCAVSASHGITMYHPSQMFLPWQRYLGVNQRRSEFRSQRRSAPHPGGPTTTCDRMSELPFKVFGKRLRVLLISL